MPFARTHSTLADGTFSATGAIAWDANQTPSGADVGGIPYCPTATSEATSAGFTFNGSTLTLAAGTITTDLQQFLTTVTRNAAGVTYGGAWKLVITDTASAAGSLAMQILGGAAGTTKLFSVDKIGNLWVGTSILGGDGAGTGVNGITLDNNNTLQWVNNSYLFGGATTGSVTGTFRLVGSGTTEALNFGGDTSSFPALKRSTTKLQVRLADDSADADLDVAALTLSALLKTKGYTVAALPAGVTGAICHVTDQLTAVAAKGVAPTGGGAVVCVVVYNGAAWVGI